MSDLGSPRRVVITGAGLICPLGNEVASVWQALRDGQSAVDVLTRLPSDVMPMACGAEAKGFTGDIDQFGPLDKKLQRAIKKGQKLMCREIEMGVAAAQLALTDAGLSVDQRDPNRTGVVFGSDYIMTLPDEFTEGIHQCQGEDGRFRFDKWGELGLPKVNPLWLLKYLPNMPASHVAIYNDLRGANNSLTLREASPGAAIAEARSIIGRGHVDAMLVGATGTRINPFRTLHASMQEILAPGSEDPKSLARPFDKNRTGAVVGEGAGVIVLEDYAFAKSRGARILAEVVGAGSSAVGRSASGEFLRQAIGNALRAALGDADAESVGHLNAHGISTPDGDRQEAQGIVDVFGDAVPPVVAPKSNFGNLGAGGGMVEAILSVFALGEGTLWPTLNYETPDPACSVPVVTSGDSPAGDSFLSVNVSPQGQASAVHVVAASG